MQCQRIFFILIVLTFLCPAVLQAQDKVKPGVESAADRDARLAWWREAKFGMFVHWGVYSVVGGKHKGQDLPNSAESVSYTHLTLPTKA